MDFIMTSRHHVMSNLLYKKGNCNPNNQEACKNPEDARAVLVRQLHTYL